MLKRILQQKGTKALLVLPYVALVQEKVRWLRNIVRDLRYPEDLQADDEKRVWRRRADEGTIRVVGFFGGGKVRATWADFDIGVCTLEKVQARIASLPRTTLKCCYSGKRPRQLGHRRLFHLPAKGHRFR